MAVLSVKSRRRHRERNTFGLPQGDRIRRELRAWFKAQRRAVVSYLKTGRIALKDETGGDLPQNIPAWDSFGLGNLPMSERMTPLLELIWDDAGQAFTAKLGLDPDSWSVVNPHTQEAINQASLDFCESTNATTHLELDDALRKTREALSEGLITRGDSVADLTRRVNEIFSGAETWRARRIAASEASRATHAAQEMAAAASGVVTGWKWLLSEDACPLCQTVARRAPAVKMGQPFAIVGDNPKYSTIKFPPLHPGCQCSLVEVLDIDPQPKWSQTLIDPTPEEQDYAEGEAPQPKRPKPAAVERPKPLPKRKPVHPIKEKLDAWEEGDARVKAIQDLAKNLGEEARFEWAGRSYAALDKLDAYTATLKPGDRRKKAVREKLKELTDAREEARGWAFRSEEQVRKEVAKIIKAKQPVEYKYTDETPAKAKGLKKTIKDGVDWLMPSIEKGSSCGIQIQAQSPPGVKRASGGFTWIKLPPSTDPQTVVHEIGHCLEDQLKGVGQIGKDFLDYRAKGQEWKNFKEMFPDRNYRDDEKGVDDEFGRYFSPENSNGRFGKTSSWYVGKYYPNRSEIISMGLEALYADGVGFAQKDPEYCKLILGILSGDLR